MFAIALDPVTVIREIVGIIILAIEYFGYVLIVRILLSWFQTAEWAAKIISFLSPITDPYLNIFRSIIPPIGGIDLSAILAFIALNILQGLFAKSI